MVTKPIAVSIGDPAGIGPETIVAGWSELDAQTRARIVVVGRAKALEQACKATSTDISIKVIRNIDGNLTAGALHCLEVCDGDADSISIGQLSAEAGEVAYQAIICATQLAINGRVAALVTGPINKKALRMAGHEFPGHTELIADMCGVDHVNMMLYLNQSYVPNSTVGLGVVHSTLHVALRDALDQLSQKLILNASGLVTEFFDRLLDGAGEKRRSKIAVAALNPHGGEQGLFGREEVELIQPAVELGLAQGLPLTGPLPCDTLMARAVGGEFDGVVAMYHDQGHIAFKLLNMHRAVNVTLGLPIVRTSAAHGTAFELAGTGQADHGGFVEALSLADKLSRQG